MNNFSLKNRIAFYYIVSAALLISVVFFSIYYLVSNTVNKNIDEHLQTEVNEYSSKLVYENEDKNDNYFGLIDNEELEKREHQDLLLDPVFLQIMDVNGNIIEKSGNLENKQLLFNKNQKETKITNCIFQGKSIRQIQFPIIHEGKIIEYILVAVCIDEENDILNNLFNTLLIIYPGVLIVLFFLAQFIAGRSIKPINKIIKISDTINKNNLKTRIPLPKHRDELMHLSETINNLLDRIENALIREKQFTSDASHELRTPLSVIKGTLEVLIRKPRNTEEYQQKVNFCIGEIDRMNNLVDQLLILARFENQNLLLENKKYCINEILDEIISQFSLKLINHKVSINKNYDKNYFVNTDKNLISIIIFNILSNAIKYSKENGIVNINLQSIESKLILKISDKGVGIVNEEIDKVFNAFYKTTYSTNHPEIRGVGLGLSIAKRLSEDLNIDISITSEVNIGTTITLII